MIITDKSYRSAHVGAKAHNLFIMRENVIVQNKDEAIKYLEDKKRSIYVSMQSSNYKVQTKGITQWDKMEALIEKVNENLPKFKRIKNVYVKSEAFGGRLK